MKKSEISQEKAKLINDIKVFRKTLLDFTKVFILKDPDWETDMLWDDLKIIGSDIIVDTKRLVKSKKK